MRNLSGAGNCPVYIFGEHIMKVYLIRHGETLWNKEKKLQGMTNVALSEKGIELAKVTAEGMKHIPIDLVISSPLDRAYETGKIIRGDRNIPIIKDERIREICFGDYEGLVYKKEGYNLPVSDFNNFFECPQNYATPPNGESIGELLARTRDFLEELKKREDLQDQTILISAHGAAVRALLTNMEHGSISGFWGDGVHKNCGVSCAELVDGEFCILFENVIYYPKREKWEITITEEKNTVKNSIGRLAFVFLSVMFQIFWLLLMVYKLNQYSVSIYLITSLLTLGTVVYLYNKKMPMSFKLLWIVQILSFPILGLSLYVMLGRSSLNDGMCKKLEKIDSWLFSLNPQKPSVQEELLREDRAVFNQSSYIRNYANYPLWNNTDVIYYSEARAAFRAQLEEIRQAKKFIFMEYHAIEDEASFSVLKKLLIKKAKEGVEVRLLYDDVGSIGFIDRDFVKRMEAEGIQCRIFNQIMPFLNVFMNNRDHRKITVVDGKVGFTGGYNLADEYFNLTNPYGQWKDTGIKMTGDAVKNLTVSFLEMWNFVKQTDPEDVSGYLETVPYKAKQSGYVQPYADIPVDHERVGETVYMNLIKNAKEYIYFTTPYLIISDEMSYELEQAAKRGVDVRIITPGIPDKKPIYQVTRSYYQGLVQAGVRIFEYSPGFLHAKQCVCDGEAAVIGTINLDYRSLYLHFENGIFLYNCPAIADMKKDFDTLFEISKEVTKEYCSSRPKAMRIGLILLKMFAPLL